MASFLVVAAVIWWLLRPAGLRIPAMLAASLPVNCEQVVLVLATEEHSQNARLWRMERTAGREWKPVGAATAVTWGHQGLAWGTGEHTDQPPTGFRIKREGDKCSPAGVFCIPFAFGLAPASEASWLKLPYIPLTPSLVGVDDPTSMHYNQVVDSTKVERDWDSNEPMARHQRV